MTTPIRVLLAKLGTDNHDRGVKVLCRVLRDAGMEVIYPGLHQTPEWVISTAIQEDVDVVGLSIHSGAHLHYAGEVARLLKANGLEGRPLLVGGSIPVRDVAKLKGMGVNEVFRADTPVREIVQHIITNVGDKVGQA